MIYREIEQLVSINKYKQNEATGVVTNPCISQKLIELGSSLNSSKAGLTTLVPSMVEFHN